MKKASNNNKKCPTCCKTYQSYIDLCNKQKYNKKNVVVCDWMKYRYYHCLKKTFQPTSQQLQPFPK